MDDSKEGCFPHAPEGWTPDVALKNAKQENIELTALHWKVIRALQEYFAKHIDQPNVHRRQLHDALDETFHLEGGIRHLYQIFPGGPIAQGCRIAGLHSPAGATDLSYGSVA